MPTWGRSRFVEPIKSCVGPHRVTRSPHMHVYSTRWGMEMECRRLASIHRWAEGATLVVVSG